MSRLHAVVALGSVWLAGCAADPAGWMADVRAWSDEAEQAEARGDTAAALERLERVLARDVPSGVAEEDARVIRQDAHERLGRLRLLAGEPDRAAEHARLGLALGERDDLFTANLHALAGRAAEARGDDREAVRAYHRALLIHEALLERALEPSDEVDR